ncbi:hypothetical protein AB870_26000 [Pandoraea faecigallinarum]|uniref:Helix-turn-helix domain-containing protein n=1 Tax=Pandoraea faecigallinarum TaxID=656179 RepID=A0A173GZZ9_9BURK|nr:hypothetical protein [Pandoraea faecigallinarum]ANI21754.1 hypothetical protein AB870_26000 [Pandoraea faecigallinarum]
MSAKVMGMVFERYPTGGGEMLLALKLADNAHDDGTRIFPSVATMAARTRQSERAVQYQLRRMQKSGWLVLVRPAVGGRGQSGMPAEYRINPLWLNGAELAPISGDTEDEGKGADSAPNKSAERVQSEAEKGATGDGKGANDDRKGCKAFAPEPSVEPSVNRQGTVIGDGDAAAGVSCADLAEDDGKPLTVNDLVHEGIPRQIAKDWMAVRKGKKQTSLTPTAWAAVKREAEKAGITLTAAVTHAVEAGWAGFKAKWLASEGGTTGGRGAAAGLNKQEQLEQRNREIAAAQAARVMAGERA